jgi:cell division protein FtsL
MKSANPLLVILAAALLLASLSLVTWRQARALEALAELDGLRREISLLEAVRTDLETRIQALESRARVVPAAGARLGMRRPNDASGEIVLLSGAEP